MIKNRGYSIKKCCFCKFLDFFEEYGIIFSYKLSFSMTKHSILRTFFHILIVTSIYIVWFLWNNPPLYATTDGGIPCWQPWADVDRCWTSPNPTDDLTKPTYMLQVGNLSPINKNEAPWGKEAITTLLSSVSSILLFILPVIAAISLIIAGYYYILSSGDSEKASQAKIIIKWNIVAILVALFSYAIIKLIASILGGSI